MADISVQGYIGGIELDNTCYYVGNTLVDLSLTPIVLDTDAAAFIAAAGITNITQIFAVNQLVVSLKAANLWTLMYAIYPMVGGTSNSCKYNLKNPVDSDAAYRLNFQGGWTFSSAGAKPDGVGGTYADTFLTPSVTLSTSNGHISYNSFTDSLVEYACEFGAIGGANTETLIQVRYGSRFYPDWGTGGNITDLLTTDAFYITNVVASPKAYEGWKDGTRLVNDTASTSTGIANRSLYLAALNSGVTNDRNSLRGCSFASIGNSLPSGGPAQLSTIVATFETNLGRS
jgi:hypothetical protein